MMVHRQKVDRLIADLGERGVGRLTVAPPLFQLLWALGLNVPPPLFLGRGQLTLLMGGFFGVVWGVLMWLVQWRFWEMPVAVGLLIAVVGAAVAGLLFGLCLAVYYRRQATRLGLTS